MEMSDSAIQHMISLQIKIDLHNTASLEPNVEYKLLDDRELVVITGGKTARIVKISVGRELTKEEWDVRI